MEKRELILKYLSGLLGKEEKIKFERELESDADLKNEFQKISEELNGLKFTPATDSEYFSNLEQKVKARVEKRGLRHKTNFAFGFGLVFSILIIFSVFEIFDGSKGTQPNQNKIVNSFSINSDEIVGNYSLNDLESLGITTDDYFSAGLSDVSVDDIINFLQTNDLNASDYLSSLNLSENSLNEIMENLKNKEY